MTFNNVEVIRGCRININRLIKNHKYRIIANKHITFFKLPVFGISDSRRNVRYKEALRDATLYIGPEYTENKAKQYI